MRAGPALGCIVAMAALLPAARAACPDEAVVAAYMADFRAARPSRGFGRLDAADAACARGMLLRALAAESGPPVGYKAVFTNAESQKRFGVDGPAWGAMFGGLMLESGARLPATFGALPRYEADFVVVVKDPGLADAGTPREALDHIAALVPFIELPDIMLAGKPAGTELVAANAAFRGGVLGPRIEVTTAKAAAMAIALAGMEVVVTEDREGREIGRAKGEVLMGHPLNAAVWLARALRADGVALKAGDLLSLGGFLGSAPAQPGTTMSASYRGLPGNPVVTVHFD